MNGVVPQQEVLSLVIGVGNPFSQHNSSVILYKTDLI